MQNVIIYHKADLDGFCSAAIARLHFNAKREDVVMVGHDYHLPSPMSMIKEDDAVVMVDISLKSDQMLLLALYGAVWIDHHKTAIADAEKDGYMQHMKGSRKVGDSASLLAWKYFFPNKRVPDVVYWVDRYDVWKKGADWKEVLEVQYGMRATLGDPLIESEYHKWLALLQGASNMGQIHETGVTITNFSRKENEVRCSRAFDIHYDGLRIAAVNAFPGGSTVLESYAVKDHDALMVFGFNGKDWSISLYHNDKSLNKPDLSVIAKRFCGGGHAGACGFTIKNIDEFVNLHREIVTDE